MDLIGEEEEEKDHGSSYMSDESSHQNFTLGAGGKPCNNESPIQLTRCSPLCLMTLKARA